MTSYFELSDDWPMDELRLLHELPADAPPQVSAAEFDELMAEVAGYDAATRHHSTRVAQYARALGRVMALGQDDVQFLYRAGLGHDVGKLAIPEPILNKPGALSPNEVEIVRAHPVMGAEMLARVAGMERIVPIALHHHEHWDGSGYPAGLSGVDIPVEARIILVADAFDAMTSPRPYGGVRTIEGGLAELRRCSGRQFDPMVVECMHSAYTHGLIEDIASPHTRATA